MVIVQSTKNSSDAVFISSSNQPAVITLSPSPTASLTDDQPLIPPSGRYKIEIDSDKESDSKFHSITASKYMYDKIQLYIHMYTYVACVVAMHMHVCTVVAPTYI